MSQITRVLAELKMGKLEKFIKNLQLIIKAQNKQTNKQTYKMDAFLFLDLQKYLSKMVYLEKTLED